MQCIVGEKTQKQEEETTGHMESAVRERRVSAGIAGFFVLFSFSLGRGWYQPHSGWVFPPPDN